MLDDYMLKFRKMFRKNVHICIYGLFCHTTTYMDALKFSHWAFIFIQMCTFKICSTVYLRKNVVDFTYFSYVFYVQFIFVIYLWQRSGCLGSAIAVMKKSSKLLPVCFNLEKFVVMFEVKFIGAEDSAHIYNQVSALE